MLKNPLLDKIKANKPALGCATGDPHLVELLAQLGMDWFYIDHMFTDNDWEKTQTLLWAGEAAGITPVIRMQAHPWLGYDHRIAVDISRAQGIGAEFMLVSHSGKREIEEALHVAKDWHRRAMTVHPFKNLDWASKVDQMTGQVYIIPHAESTGALEEIEETMALPDLKMFFVGMTDASLQITGSKNPDIKNPKLWAYLKKVIDCAERNNIYVGANTSYAYTITGMRERVKMLVDAGFKFIMMQTAPFLFQIGMMELLDGIASDINR